jgi:hypothetical protein
MYPPYVVIPGSFKPPLGARVNLSHPLGRNCAFCIPLCNTGEKQVGTRGQIDPQFYNTRKYQFPTAQAGSLTASHVSSKWGGGIGLTSIDGATVSATDVFGQSACTIALIRRCQDTTNRAALMVGTNGAGSGGYVYFAANGAGSGAVFIFGGTGGGGTNRVDATYNKQTALTEMWVGAAGPRGISMWKDSIKLASQTTPISRTGLGAATVINGDGDFCIGADNAEFYFILVSNDQWSDNQIRSWFAAPFSMLYPAYDQLSSVPLFGSGEGSGSAGTHAYGLFDWGVISR